MRTRLTQQSGQPGTKQLVAEYGAETLGTPIWLNAQIRTDGVDSSPQVSEWKAGRTRQLPKVSDNGKRQVSIGGK